MTRLEELRQLRQIVDEANLTVEDLENVMEDAWRRAASAQGIDKQLEVLLNLVGLENAVTELTEYVETLDSTADEDSDDEDDFGDDDEEDE